ncbi:hypothetical protein SAMN05216378_0784 [Paenibacillus catalpae]|uniref:Uncharacterized protein n=1 Tax=Paenibacillus catalpae TaxID=1045775 RepID=A0A1I1TZN5_9BACL|nr:hypothetical protein [Paenibacillus catalpae]SFD64037.1 hypothetical protein SAMN05216378_0784 [Paenibacillus catalpae]
MELRVYKALWGMEGTYEEQLGKTSAAGYYGIEAPLPQEGNEQSYEWMTDRVKESFNRFSTIK